MEVQAWFAEACMLLVFKVGLSWRGLEA